MNVQKLNENWRKDHALLLSHIGSSDGHVGLKSPIEQLGIDNMFLRAKGIGDQIYDCLNVVFGKYIGKNFKNAPVGIDIGSLCILTISGYPGFLRHMVFFDTTTNMTYERTIYRSNDTGWNDNSSLSGAWRDIQLINGFTGTAKVSKFNSNSFQGLEIRLDIVGKVSSGLRSMGFGTLPAGYTTLQANRIYFTGISSPFEGDITNDNTGVGEVSPIGISVGGGKDLFVHPLDSNNSDKFYIRTSKFIRRGSI